MPNPLTLGNLNAHCDLAREAIDAQAATVAFGLSHPLVAVFMPASQETDMDDEIMKRATRISEINQEIAGVLPEFLQASGGTQAVKADGRIWAERLGPLLDENHRFKLEIDALFARGI